MKEPMYVIVTDKDTFGWWSFKDFLAGINWMIDRKGNTTLTVLGYRREWVEYAADM
jgi:hypothetical protein